MPLSTREKKLILGFICVLGILFLWFKGAQTQNQPLSLLESIGSQEESPPILDENEESKEPQQVMVHISGAVHLPGLYQGNTDNRVADMVKMAGGFLPEADQSAINLAKKVRDEEKIHVPKIGETPAPQTGVETGNGQGLININSADEKALKELPGVGEKTAQKIITYREETPFSSIEDLKNVPGIGDKKFEEMKDYITY